MVRVDTMISDILEPISEFSAFKVKLIEKMKVFVKAFYEQVAAHWWE